MGHSLSLLGKRNIPSSEGQGERVSPSPAPSPGRGKEYAPIGRSAPCSFGGEYIALPYKTSLVSVSRNSWLLRVRDMRSRSASVAVVMS